MYVYYIHIYQQFKKFRAHINFPVEVKNTNYAGSPVHQYENNGSM